MLKLLFSFIFVCLLCACGGGGGSAGTATSITPVPVGLYKDVSLGHVGDPFVYADANWNLPAGQSNVGAWVVHGTIETPQGLVITTSSPANGLYNGSFINVGVAGAVFIKQQPIVNITYAIQTFSGTRARATIGISMQYPNGQPYFLEQELLGGFDLCSTLLPFNLDATFDRCGIYDIDNTYNIIYFSPKNTASPLAFDIRTKLLESPDMTPAKADSLQIIGVYVGSEIFGQGQVDLTIQDFNITARVPQ